ncbi:MAG: lytic transglycosylase domain-containing protein [Gammaproteobacteria bacterium]|nr:lytic transglycosylase domain-containing protein [Gammaproteobacteria bacterium]
MTRKLLLIAALLLACAPLYADYYKYVTPGGKVMFTDEPLDGPYKLVWHKQQILLDKNSSCSPVKSSSNQAGATVYMTAPSGIHITKPRRSSIKPQLDVKSTHTNRALYSDMIDDVARKSRLYPELLHAVVKAESAYDPNAVSRAGAVGLMQLMPQTASRFGVADRRDPKSNLEGGARYLRKLITNYNNNIKLALAAYNAGETAVEKYGNEIPPYPETQNYVKKVLAFFKQNRKQLALAN